MNTKKLPYYILSICLGLAAITTQAGSIKVKPTDDDVPTGKGWGKPKVGAPARVPNVKIPQNGIFYHGGPVLGVNTVPNVYFIWYGNWSGNTAQGILENLASHLGGTPRYNIETTYTNSSGSKIKNAVSFVNSTTDNYSQGAPVNGTATINDAGIYNVVSNAINAGSLPLDANGVYFVLTSKDVNESSGFCTSYCGWHDKGTINQQVVKYSFIGNPERCPSACTNQTTVSPNNNIGADGMASIFIHELEEAVTDPEINAWYDNSGNENADKCAWQFGTTSTATNGSKYNVTIGGLNYLLQQNWVNAAVSGKKGFCASSY